jgi:hypothetical protein
MNKPVSPPPNAARCSIRAVVIVHKRASFRLYAVPLLRWNASATQTAQWTQTTRGTAVTESTERSDAHLALAELVNAALRRAGKLGPTTVITHCVTVVQTLTETDTGPRFDIHRIHPMGTLDPSTERGVLADAIEDSRRNRYAS